MVMVLKVRLVGSSEDLHGVRLRTGVGTAAGADGDLLDVVEFRDDVPVAGDHDLRVRLEAGASAAGTAARA